MGLFPANFKSAADRVGAAFYPVLKVTFPEGVRRYAKSEVGSASQGTYEGRVLEWGSIARGGTDRGGRLLPLETRVVIDDTDRSFVKMKEGAKGNVRGSAAVIDIFGEGLAYADRWTAFTGIFWTAKLGPGRKVTFVLRSDDGPLNNASPKTPIMQVDFPNAKAEALGQYAPNIYGIHDATALGATAGAVPCLYVDTVGFRYLVCIGRAKTIRRVFSGSDLKTLTTDYSVDYTTINGRLWTLINFVSDQQNAAVTVDLEGYETVGDGSGSTITNPAQQLEHWLANFVWNEYKSGNWLDATAAPLDTTSWTATKTWMTDLALKGSRRIAGTQPKGSDIVGGFADEWLVKFFWTNLGKLAVQPQELRVSTVYISDPWLREGNGHEIGESFYTDEEATDIKDRLMIKHCYLEAQGSFSQTLEIRDPALNEEAPDTVDLRWSPSYVV